MNPIDFQEKIIWHKFKNGRSLVDFVTYKGVALWWTTDEKFFEFLNPLILSKNKKQQIKRTHILIPRIFGGALGPLLLLFLDVFLFLFLNFISAILTPIRKKQIDRTKPLVITSAQDNNWRLYRDYIKNQKRKADYFLEPMIPELNTFASVLGIYPLQIFTKPISSFKKFIDRVINWSEPFKPFQTYWSPKSWLSQKKVLNYNKRNLRLILQDKSFKNKLVYEKINYAPYILEELSYMLLYLIPLAANYIETTINLIENESPFAFLIMNEYSLWERSLLIAAKLEKIPVIAIQHGEIPKIHRGYLYSERDISPIGDYKAPYCPVPDKIAVYGEYYKELLTEKSFFPKDIVVVTGQPRYDVIYFIKQKYKNVSSIRKTFGLPENKKILLWTTQTHGMPDDENKKNIEAVYSAMKEISEVELVVKLHPNEDQNAPLYKQNTILRPRIISGQADTFLLLHASDIAMTKSSTTGLEAIAFEKPLIILNLSGKPDTVDFVSEGVAVGVYNPDEFRDAVLNILSGKVDLSKNRERYIRQKLYKIDAKASHRVVNIVKDLLKPKELINNE